jgi:hypothetical protein
LTGVCPFTGLSPEQKIQIRFLSSIIFNEFKDLKTFYDLSNLLWTEMYFCQSIEVYLPVVHEK